MQVGSSQFTKKRYESNRRHWDQTLDAQNLKGDGPGLSLETQLALAETADVRAAFAALAPLRGRTVLDIGGGLGLMAILLARRGARVVIADISPARLRAARALAEQAGVSRRISCVCCSAEELPFASSVMPGVISKSVLIHTDLVRSAAEIARVLAGKAALIEPTTGNPFVNLYRRLGAPAIWQEITDYFDESRFRLLEAPFHGAQVNRKPLFFLAFFATPFNFSLPMPRVYRALEGLLCAIDAALFRLPVVRKFAWFQVVSVDQESEVMARRAPRG